MLSSRYYQAYGFWHAGEGFQTILMMWYMTFHARLPAADIGFYQSLQLLPFLAITAVGGSVTDRIGARASYAASTLLFALTLASGCLVRSRGVGSAGIGQHIVLV